MLAPAIIEMIGLAGGMMLLASWAFETAEEIKHHKTLLDLRFSFGHFLGIAVLAIYSFLLNLQIFIWLNIFIAAIIIFEIAYSIHVKKIHKAKRSRRH